MSLPKYTNISISYDDVLWTDITSYVLDGSVDVTICAMNDRFLSSQNSASFTVIYDAVLYSQLVSATSDIYVHIYHYPTAEDPYSYSVFKGKAPPSFKREYDGVLATNQVVITAADSTDDLNVAVGDIVYRSTPTIHYTVYNPVDTAHSIVHLLASIAGFDSTRLTDTVTISTELAAFAPESIEDTALYLISTLLYEHGYVLSFDEMDNIVPVLWNIPTSSSPVTTFNSSNICSSLTEDIPIRKYDGIEVTYFEVREHPTPVMIYHDSNMPYDAYGGFSGYTVFEDMYYPTAANAIDPLTGLNQIVTQEYTDTAIKYKTNAAIVNNLDINRDTVPSDFSSILATYDHYSDYSVETGIIKTSETFGNKHATVLFQNTSAANKLFYYFDIYASVIYRAEARSVKKLPTVDPDKNKLSYTSQYLTTAGAVSAFASGLINQYQNKMSTFSFDSQDRIPVGSLVTITPGDGLTCEGIILQRTYQSASVLKWSYTVLQYIRLAVSATENTATVPSSDTSTASTMAVLHTKTRTFVTPTMPVVGMHSGDTWLDSDDANKEYVYVGGAWVVGSAMSVATDAAAAASVAALDATAALTTLGEFANDGILDPLEKTDIRLEWNTIVSEKTMYNAQAATFVITTENTAYNTQFQALADYLNAGVSWVSGYPNYINDANKDSNTSITRTVYNTKWKNYYDARTTLLNAIAAKAKTLADAAQFTATSVGSVGQPPVLYYSMDRLPDVPDGPYTWKRDGNFTSVDISTGAPTSAKYAAWNGSAWNPSILSIVNGQLVYDGPLGAGGRLIRINIDARLKIRTMRILPPSNCTLSIDQNDYGHYSFNLIGNQWNTLTAYIFDRPSATFIDIEGFPTSGVTRISADYIGDGSYSSQLSDDSGNGNNATIELYPDSGTTTTYRVEYFSTTDSWNPTNCTLVASGGVLQLTATTTDPYMIRAITSFSGTVHRFISIRFRQTSGALGGAIGIYGDTGATAYKQVPYTSAGINVWQTVLIDMSTCDIGSWIGSTITAIRIDIPNDAVSLPTVMEISHIYVGDGTYAPQTGGAPGAASLVGVNGKAIQFNKAGSATSVFPINLVGKLGFSYSFWLSCTNIVDQPAPFNHAYAFIDGFHCQVLNTGQLRMWFSRAGAIDYADSTTAVVDATLRHFAITYIDSTKTYCLYVDGVLNVTGILPNQMILPNRQVIIGGVPSYRLLGVMDEVRVYDRTLSSHEVYNLYVSKNIPIPYSADIVPTYLGKYLASHPTTHNNGDWWLVYDTDDSPIVRGVYRDDAGLATLVTTDSAADSEYYAAALSDIMTVCNNVSPDYGETVNYGAITFIANLVANSAFINTLTANTAFINTLTANTVFINSLMAKGLVIQVGGHIRGGDRYDASGDTIDETLPGFYLGSDGFCKVSGIEINGYMGDRGLGGLFWSGADEIGTSQYIDQGSGPGVIAYSDHGRGMIYFPVNGGLCALINTTGTWSAATTYFETLSSSGTFGRMVRCKSMNYALLRKNSSSVYELDLYMDIGTDPTKIGSSLTITGEALDVIPYNETTPTVSVLSPSTPTRDSLKITSYSQFPSLGFFSDNDTYTLSTGLTNYLDIACGTLLDDRTLVVLVKGSAGQMLIRYADIRTNHIRNWQETSRTVISGSMNYIRAKSSYEILYTVVGSSTSVRIMTWTGSTWVDSVEYLSATVGSTSNYATPISGTDYLIYDHTRNRILHFRAAFALSTLFNPGNLAP